LINNVLEIFNYFESIQRLSITMT